MFERILNRLKSPSRVSFDDGSYIEFFNREAIVYVEHDGHRMEVVWYFQRGRIKGRVLNICNIDNWDPPHDLEPLSSEKKEEIERKIVEYCRRRRIPVEINRPSGVGPS